MALHQSRNANLATNDIVVDSLNFQPKFEFGACNRRSRASTPRMISQALPIAYRCVEASDSPTGCCSVQALGRPIERLDAVTSSGSSDMFLGRSSYGPSEA
jgi:hypothetical protein